MIALDEPKSSSALHGPEIYCRVKKLWSGGWGRVSGERRQIRILFWIRSLRLVSGGRVAFPDSCKSLALWSMYIIKLKTFRSRKNLDAMSASYKWDWMDGLDWVHI